VLLFGLQDAIQPGSLFACIATIRRRAQKYVVHNTPHFAA
jgi:hypothetical protein